MADEPKNPFGPEGRSSDTTGLPERETTGDLSGSGAHNADVFAPAAPAETLENEGSGFWRAFYHDKKLFYSTLGALGLVLVIGGLIVYFLFGRETPPPPPDVQMGSELPSRVVVGQPFDFEINYSNRSNQTLTNMKLSLIYPQGFAFRESNPAASESLGQNFNLADLSAGQTDQVKVRGVLDGQIGDKKEIQANLQYKIKGYRTTYVSQETISLEISSPDLTLLINGPNESITDQEVVYSVSYKNISDKVLRNIKLALNVPNDFTISETTPALNNASLHALDIGDLPPGFEGGFRIKGFYTQAARTQRIVEVVAIEQAPEERIVSRAFTVTQVDDSPVVVRQSISDSGDDVVLPGENLTYFIKVENRSDITLTNLVVSTSLEGEAFDLTSLRADGGILTDHTITWTPGGASALKSLKPNTAVDLAYSIRISSPPTQSSQSSLTISTTPKVTSFEFKEPVMGASLTLKIKTIIDHTQQVTYESGAEALQAGQETRYRVAWRVENTTNTVIDAKVTGDLPLGEASFIRGDASPGSSISFQPGPYAIVWDIGTVAPHSQTSAYFIIGVRPSVANRGSTPALVKNIKFEGFDSFVNQRVFDETPVDSAHATGTVQ